MEDNKNNYLMDIALSNASLLCSFMYPTPLTEWYQLRKLDWDDTKEKYPEIERVIEAKCTAIKDKLGSVDEKVVKQYYAFTINTMDEIKTERTNHAKS